MKRKRIINAGLALTMILAASSVWAAGQGGPGDQGNPPSGLTFGDANKPDSYVVTASFELRDVPNTEGGVLSNIGSRLLRVAARVDDGDAFKIITFDYACGQPAIVDSCSSETICTIGNGNKEECVIGQVVDFRKVPEIQALVVSLLGPRIIAAYGLDPNTVLELTKVKEYVQTPAPVVGEDGIVSFFVITDLALSEQ